MAIMAPQSEAGPEPRFPHPHDDFRNEDDDDDSDDDDGDGEVIFIPAPEYFQFQHPPQQQQLPLPPQPQVEPQIAPQPQVEPQQLNQQRQEQRQYSPQERSRLEEICSKFETLGVDLVRHIVLASVSSTPSAPGLPHPDDEPLHPSPHHHSSVPFPPPNRDSVNIINLFTTDRETLTMRRLVTKALVEKAHSFNNTIFILPRIPVDVEEFRDIFGAVVDRVVTTVPQQRQQQQQQQQDAEENGAAIIRDVSWGKLVTAYAFGLRLIKAFIDQRRDGDFARHRQIQHLLDQQPPEEQQRLREQLELQRHLHQQQRVAAIQREPAPHQPRIPDIEEEELDPHEWGTALGRVLHERMGEWVFSRGGWSVGFNDHFLDRRGLEQVVTKKLFCAFALGIGFMILYKLVGR